MPRTPIHAGRTHAHEDLGVPDRGPGDVGKPEHVVGCGAVLVLDDRLHGLRAGGGWRRLRRSVERCGRHGFLRLSLTYVVSRLTLRRKSVKPAIGGNADGAPAQARRRAPDAAEP